MEESKTNKLVLLVEPEAMVRRLLLRILNKGEGCSAVGVSDAHQAKRLLADNPDHQFDLVVSAFSRIGDMNGVELLCWFKDQFRNASTKFMVQATAPEDWVPKACETFGGIFRERTAGFKFQETIGRILNSEHAESN